LFLAQCDALVLEMLMQMPTVHSKARVSVNDLQLAIALLPVTAVATVSELRLRQELAKPTTDAVLLL
jgi:hypothetical protein